MPERLGIGREPRVPPLLGAGLFDLKIKSRLSDLGGTVLANSPAEFGKLIAEETEKWAKVVKFSGARPD